MTPELQIALEKQLLSAQHDFVMSADPNVLPRPPGFEDLIDQTEGSIWNPLGLASDLPSLVALCHRKGFQTSGLVRLAMTCSEPNAIALVERFGPGWFESKPLEDQLIADGWVLNGFDVVDLQGLISGLTGCGFNEQSKPALQKYFESDMNQFALFRTCSIAQAFSEVRGLQIASHAPFIVVGILSQMVIHQ